MSVRGDRKSIKELAGIFEKVYDRKVSLECLGSIKELGDKMLRDRQQSPEDVVQWLGLHYHYFTITGRTLFEEGLQQRYPELRLSKFEDLFSTHAADELATMMKSH